MHFVWVLVIETIDVLKYWPFGFHSGVTGLGLSASLKPTETTTKFFKFNIKG